MKQEIEHLQPGHHWHRNKHKPDSWNNAQTSPHNGWSESFQCVDWHQIFHALLRLWCNTQTIQQSVQLPTPQEWHLQVWHFTTPQVELLFWDAHTHVIQNRSTKVATFISRRSSQSFCQEQNTYTMDNHPCVVMFAVQHPNNSTICPTSHTPKMTLTSYKYGISPLHKWIRCFEMFIHISYRIDQYKSGKFHQQKIKSKFLPRRNLVHDRFKAEQGLRIDEPKRGAGNTNHGNLARRAFEQEEKFAKICELDESLMHRFHMILVAISNRPKQIFKPTAMTRPRGHLG